MSSTHNDAHDELLVQVLCGDLSREDEAVRELASSCDVCRTQLEELSAVVAELEAGGERDRVVLDKAEAGSTQTDEKLVASLMSELWEREAQPIPNLAWRRLVAVAAAILVLGLGWSYFGGSDPAPIVPVIMGPDDEGCVGPAGEVAEFGEFVWKVSSVPGQTFTLVIVNEVSLERVVHETGLVETRYVLSEEQRTRLDKEIYWQVQVIEADGSSGRAFDQRASLR